MDIKKASKSEKIAAAGTILSFAISAVFIKFSGFSVSSAVNIGNILMKKMLIDAGGLNTFGSISVLLGHFLNIFIALAFLTLAFAFLAAYGFYEDRKKVGIALSAIGGLIFFFSLGFTLASLVVAIGVVFAGYSLIPLASNYGQEFKKWIHFRVGSNSISRSHFIFNLFVALAIFAAVLSNLAFYQTQFRADMKESVSAVIKPSLPQGVDEKALDAQISRQVDAMLASPLFSAYFSWLPAFTAFGIWAILEVLRVFLPFLAGAFTSVLIKISG